MKQTMRLKSIDSIKQKYLKRAGIVSQKDISLVDGNTLFLLVIDDFKKGILALDEFAGFGFYIFHVVAKQYPTSPLFQAALSASELGFAVRSPAVYRNIVKYLTDIDIFYKQNEH